MSMMMAVAPLEVLSFYKGVTVKPFLLLFPAVVAGLGWRYRCVLRRRWNLTEWDWCILVCWGWAFVSCLFAVSTLRGLRMAIQLGMVFVPAIGTAHLITTREEVNRYLRFFRWSAIIVCAYALWQSAGYFFGFPSQQLLALARRNPTLPRMLVEPGAIVFSESMSIIRVSSTFFDWNIFSAYLVMLLPLLLGVAWRKLLSRHLPATAFWGLILLAGIWLLTFSRSGWLGGATAMVTLMAFGLPVRLLIRRYAVVLAAVFILCLIAQIDPVTLLAHRVGQTLAGEQSVQEHARYGLAALDMLRDHPLTGVGVHNFAPFYQQHYDPNEPGATAHSGLLSLFAEMGLVGGVIYVLTFLTVISRVRKAQHSVVRDDPDGIFLRSLLAAAVGLGVCNVFYHFWTELFLWCFLGFCIGAIKAFTKEPEA
jgi:hypothetical protein